MSSVYIIFGKSAHYWLKLFSHLTGNLSLFCGNLTISNIVKKLCIKKLVLHKRKHLYILYIPLTIACIHIYTYTPKHTYYNLYLENAVIYRYVPPKLKKKAKQKTLGVT